VYKLYEYCLKKWENSSQKKREPINNLTSEHASDSAMFLSPLGQWRGLRGTKRLARRGIDASYLSTHEHFESHEEGDQIRSRRWEDDDDYDDDEDAHNRCYLRVGWQLPEVL
jgi:hypothetical protein